MYLAQNLVHDHKEYNEPTHNKTQQYDTNRIIKRTQQKEDCTHTHQKQEP